MNRREFIEKVVSLGCALGAPVSGFAGMTGSARAVPQGRLVEILLTNPPPDMSVGDVWRPKTGPLLRVDSFNDAGEARLVPFTEPLPAESVDLYWLEVTV